MKRSIRKILGILLIVLMTGVLYGCSGAKPDNETITSDISSYLQPGKYDHFTRTYENIKEVESDNRDRLLYSFDVIETRESDDNAYFAPGYKLKQKYYARYKKEKDGWGFDSAYTKSKDAPTFEYLEEVNMEHLKNNNFPEFDSYEITNSTLDLKNGRASYTMNLQYEGDYFSKTTEVSLDLKINPDDPENEYSWGFIEEPVFKDISMDTTKLLGKWTMKTSNGSLVSIDIKDISNGKATLHFDATHLRGMGLLDTASTTWVGKQDENLMNKFHSDKITLYFPAKRYSDHIVFNGEKFYK